VFQVLPILFFLLVFVVFYTYIGYGIVAWLFVKILPKRAKIHAESGSSGQYQPAVTLIVPAYNERDYLPEKLQNCLIQDYPAQLLNLLFVVEGSTDGSAEYLEKMRGQVPNNLSIISGTARLGKVTAMNNAMKQVRTPITIFTDANTQLNPEAVSRLVAWFASAEIGAVTGEKRIQVYSHEAAAGSGEGLYWKYESFLKRVDAELYSIVGAAGELFAVRTELYEPVEADTLLDDFVISLRIAGRGYRVAYAPDAYALERPSQSVAEEMKRKIRIATGGFQAMKRLSYLLNIVKYGVLTFQYVSHRVLRWAITPFCLPLLLVINAILLLQPSPFWWVVFAGQVLFYAVAGLGYVLENRQTRWKLTFVPFYFVFMNWCVLVGFGRFWRGNINAAGVWDKAKRAI
jgi:cellulose synthase/poly-beta-1,6-N-acetylglucosamine synthase-like glycosyltransferase